MRKIILIFLVLSLFVSCSKKEETIVNDENTINSSGTVENGSGNIVSDTPIEAKKSTYTSKKGKEVIVNESIEGTKISSPLHLTGKVPTNWVFEAVFGVGLYTSSGEIIKQHYGTANIWDENQQVILPSVDFVLDVEYDMEKYDSVPGYIELRNDNPSGLPEHEDSIKIPVIF